MDNASAVIHTGQITQINKPTNQGTLKVTGDKEYTFFSFAQTQSISQGVSEFLSEINKLPELLETLLLEHTFVEINQEMIENETEIVLLLRALFEMPHSEKKEISTRDTLSTDTKIKQPKQKIEKPSPSHGQQQIQSSAKEAKSIKYSSIFSLARSFNKGHQQERVNQKTEQKDQEHIQAFHKNIRSDHETMNQNTLMFEIRHDQQDRKKLDEEKKEGFGGQQDQQEQEQKKRHKSFKVQASSSASGAQKGNNSSSPSTNQRPISIKNVYIRFMALMARILGQAEAEAHDLYLRIKQRTDSIDLLTALISKINSEKGEIDWSNNEEMKQLIEKARELGVDIPKEKYKWSEDERKLLKENIQMRKDSMEKVTQLERTDMQRFLQEASQCHQARSNVLKLLKEVMDTIIHNMRP